MFKAQRPRAEGDVERHSPLPLSIFPTAAEILLLLEAGRAHLGQAEGPEAALDEYIQEASLETEIPGLLVLNFAYFGRHGQLADRPETFRISSLVRVSLPYDFDC